MIDPQETIRRLELLREGIAWPEHGRIAPKVADRIRRTQPRRPPLRWAAAGAALMIVALAAWSPARQVAADLFGIFGIQIQTGETLGSNGDPLDESAFGRRTTTGDARRAAGFELRAPSGLGAPDATYVTEEPVGVIQVWQSGPALPRIGETDLGLMFFQFLADTDTAAYVKRLDPDVTITQVDVDESGGYWIEGAHEFSDLGGPVGARLAANVLLWHREGITYRLESNLTIGAALEIAETLTAAS